MFSVYLCACVGVWISLSNVVSLVFLSIVTLFTPLESSYLHIAFEQILSYCVIGSIQLTFSSGLVGT